MNSAPVTTLKIVAKKGFSPNRRVAFDFSAEMKRLCEHVVRYSPVFKHVDFNYVLITATYARNRTPFGLQARLTPLRFKDGSRQRVIKGVPYQVEPVLYHGVELKYLLTFCLPRFLNLGFDEKLVTVFHELYHISPNFDGDMRRLSGRYVVHSHSCQAYDALMLQLVRDYLHKADGNVVSRQFGWLHENASSLLQRFDQLTSLYLRRPRMFPVRSFNGSLE